ncbi:MAG: cyclodeaminase/cyclohydrolase family protein [Clostridiales bacterium]|nr:cyclodeaminase/cyclohydrolase family protein [Clostridiales bacterium]
MFKDITLSEFVSQTSSSQAVPGGGSVAALTAANGASLIAMLCNLTVGKKGYEEHWDKMKEVAEICSQKAQEFLGFIDKDSKAFNDYMQALKMPKGDKEEIMARELSITSALYDATFVPLQLAKNAEKLFEYADYAISFGNKMATSDGAIATILLKSAITSALYNVKINLPAIENVAIREKISSMMVQIEKKATKQEKTILEKVKL